jgi:hypothetical protein
MKTKPFFNYLVWITFLFPSCNHNGNSESSADLADSTVSSSNQNSSRKSEPNPNDTVNIPVIVHVVYDDHKSECYVKGANENHNLETALIRSELKDLQQDFLLLNDTSKVLPKFKHLIANPKIHFYLDTTYNTGAESGIIRIYTKKSNNWEFVSPIIDHKKYLNVYIVNYDHSYTENDNVWNYPKKDCIFLYYCWVGRGYRLLSHEAGHWLGLLHLWGTGTGKGDKNSCKIGDKIDDTPPQIEATDIPCDICPPPYGHAHDKGCNTVTSNYNNFMDYSGCRKMFTKKQVDTMRYNLFTYRYEMVANSSR